MFLFSIEKRHNVCHLMKLRRGYCRCNRWVLFRCTSTERVPEKCWSDLFDIALHGITHQYWGELSDEKKWAYTFIFMEGLQGSRELKHRLHWCSSARSHYCYGRNYPLQSKFGPGRKVPSIFEEALFRRTCSVEFLVQSMRPTTPNASRCFGDAELDILVEAEIKMFDLLENVLVPLNCDVVALASADKTIQLRDLANGGSQPILENDSATATSSRPDRKKIVLVAYRDEILLWDIAGNKCWKMLDCPGAAIVFSLDVKVLAPDSGDGEV